MKILDTAMTEIVRGNSTRYYSKYVVDGKEHTDTLNNFKFQNIINPNNEITIGNTCSSSVTFSVYMPQVSLENKEVTIYEGVKVSNEIKYIKLGIFTVTKQTSDGEYTSYEAYDRMYKADMPYFSDMAFPNTDKAILNEICGKLGISLATNIATTHTINDKPQGYTYREIIGYMAMLQGCNAVINSDGNLELRWYKDSDYALDGHKYYQQGVTFTTSKDFIIEKLTCNNTKSGDKETSTITSGSGATGLSFANPFMTQAILDEVYKKIGGFTFRPLTVKFVGDYRLEVGDIITVNKGGVDYKVPIMQITHECDGGLMDTVTSIGQSDTENSNIASGPITKQMERYYANLLVVNKALINKLDVDTAKITYATITNLTAVKGDVDYLKVNNLTVDKANLLYASIKRMEVVEGQIRNLNVDDLKAQVANINTLMFGSASGGSLTTEFSNSIVANIGDAQIKSAMIESIAADKITSGKIYTNLVEILSESGNLDIADNTIQIKDDNKVTRVQIGKDATNDYNIYVWDKSGNLMFDALGLTENGVKREIIRNDMIKEDANINASKLDIESLFNVINEDGSHTLKSSKIYVDANKQTLDVAFKNMTTNVTNLQNTVTTQGTQLTAVQGQISSKVWKQDITTAVNDIQIGGTNLIRNSNFFQKDAYWTYDTGTGTIISDNSVIGNVLVFKPTGGYLRVFANTWNVWVANEIYTVSFYAKASVANTTITPSRSMADSASAVTLTTTWKRYTGTIRSTATSDSGTLSFSVNNINATYYIAAVKLEKGNKATDWSPAPEDVDSSISAVDNKVTTISNQYTSLNQSLTSLTATVNSNTTAISKKADGSTVTALQANMTALTADLSGFKTTVSKTYTSKTEFNNLQIGGRNLAESTNQGTTGWGWSMKAGGYTQSEIVENNIRTCKLLRNSTAQSGWSVIEYTRIGRSKYEPNTVYTVSFDVKSNVNTVMNLDLLQGDGTDNLMGSSTAVNRQIKANQWNKLIWIIKTVTTLPSSTGQLLYLTAMNSGTGVWYQFKNLKIEKGNKATDWTPAPEDIDEKFTNYSTTTQMNNAITQAITAESNSIKLEVSNTYATKDSLSSYSTTTQMNAAISTAISKESSAIKLEVAGAYATKDSLKNYATTASLSAYIKKDPKSGELKSAIEAIADTINITARGGLNLSGNRFTLNSTNTSITADGTITCKNFVGNGGTIGGWNINSTSIYSDYKYDPSVGYGLYRVSLNKSTGSDSKIFSVRETVKDNVFNYPFYVRSDGYMYSVKGQISGFQFDSNKMSNTASIYLLPDKDVLHTLRNAIVNNTTSQLALSQYDLNGSGKVDLTDFVVAKNYVLGTQTETDFSKWKYAKKSDITYKLNPSDVKNALSISGTDIWGKTRKTTLGIGTLYSNEISCDNLTVKDPVDYSTFNTFLNTINVKETSTSIDLENFVRNYTIKGNGMLVVNISIWTDVKDDYGTTTAKIYIDGNCVMNNRNRLANSHPSELAGGATFVWWFNDNATHRIKLEAGSTKEGTKTYTQSIQALFGLQIST
jgi:hypothetical protein